jgi:alginate O-acetyltransferase complex protein AlgJ
MLGRYRRSLVLIAAVVLAAPLLLTVLSGKGESISEEERRALTPLPGLPRTVRDWDHFPRNLDAYLRDHFVPRGAMILAHAVLAHGLFDLSHWVLADGNDDVLIGPQGRMFYRGNAMIEQSAGLIVRSDAVLETADVVRDVASALASRGIRFVFAVVPNSATIYPEDLPPWARNTGLPTETDTLLRDLSARHVLTVDLRAALMAAKADGLLYMKHDSHWTPDGSRVGFNALVEALGRPQWQIPATALGAPQITRGGDLARMLGVGDAVSEWVRPLTLPAGEVDASSASLLVSTMPGGQGPTVLVLGDSFTRDFFATLITANARRFVWVNHQACGFDWHWIDRFRPDEVWWIPTERLELCAPGVRPKDMPPASAAP